MYFINASETGHRFGYRCGHDMPVNERGIEAGTGIVGATAGDRCEPLTMDSHEICVVLWGALRDLSHIDVIRNEFITVTVQAVARWLIAVYKRIACVDHR